MIPEGVSRFCVGVASVVRWCKEPDPKLNLNKPGARIDTEASARDDLDAYQLV